jgi:hypothetical protein
MKKLMLPLCICLSFSLLAQPPGYVPGTQVCWNFNGRDHGYFRAAGNGERHILISFTHSNDTGCANMNTNAPQKWLGGTWNGKTVRAPGDTIIWEILTIPNTNNNWMGAYASDINYFFTHIPAIDTTNHSLFHMEAIAGGVNRMWGYLTNAQTHNSPYRHIFSTTISISTGYLGSSGLFPGINAYSAGRRHWVWYGTADAVSAPNASIQLYDNLQGDKKLTAQAGGTHGASTWDSCLSTKGADANTNRWKWMAGSAQPPVAYGPPGYVPGTQVCWTFNGREHGYFRAAGNGERHILVSFLGVGETSCSDMNTHSPQKLLVNGWNGKTVRAAGDTIIWEILTLPHNAGFTSSSYAADIVYFFNNIEPIDTSKHRRFHLEGLSAGAYNIWRYMWNEGNHNSPYRHIFSTSFTMSVPLFSASQLAKVGSAGAGRRNWIWHGTNDSHASCPPRASDSLYKYAGGIKRLTMQAGGGHNAVTWDSGMSIKGSDTNTNRWKWMVTFPAGFPQQANIRNSFAADDLYKATGKLQLYPNPAITNVMITWDLPAPSYRLTITDAMGRMHKVVQNIRRQQYALDISSLQKGVYIIHIDAGNQKIQRKLVKE